MENQLYQAETSTTISEKINSSHNSSLSIGIIAILCILMLGIGFIGGYYYGSSTSNTSDSTNLVQNPKTPQSDNNMHEQEKDTSPQINQQTWVVYNFENYKPTFKYPNSLEVIEHDGIDGFFVELTNENTTIVIRPNHLGLGFNNPNIELTEEHISSSNRELTKTKLQNNQSGEISFFSIIPYPEESSGSVMISQRFDEGTPDEESMKIFDEIAKSVEISE